MAGSIRFSAIFLAGAASCAMMGAARSQSILNLDVVTITAGKTSESAIEALAGVSYISEEDLAKLNAALSSGLFIATPGIVAAPLGNDPGTIFNIRGLQDFGRVAVTVDGARQNFSRNSHAGNGAVYIEPDLLKSVTVVRGPAANSYGSGAIGGVVAFETIDAKDVLLPGETWALASKLGYESNGSGFMSSVTAANRFSDTFDVLGGFVYRNSEDYKNAENEIVTNSGQSPKSGLVKASFRPAGGHEVELSGLFSRNDYLASRSAGTPGASTDDTDTDNTTLTGKWTYSRPEDRLFDFAGTVYWNRTVTDQIKICCGPSGSTGNIGSWRQFDVRTTGFDLHNTSRADGFGFAHAFTYGVDYFKDDVDSVSDPTSTGRSTASATGSGERAAYGSFVQWEGKHANWLELLAALRYDGFDLSGQDDAGNPASLNGGRFSPKATIGVTPVPGMTIYGTYAEGYRAPSITETFVGGTHQNDFTWKPNANLHPETARNFEAGVNFKYDNVLTEGDALRAKLSVFHTMIDDYIDIVPIGGGFSQYQNIGEARLKGVELEGTYDAGWSYVTVGGSLVDARKVATGAELSNATAPRDKFSASLGFRGMNRSVDYGVQWVTVGTTNSIFGPTAAYNLLNLYANWQINPSMSLAFNVDNLLNESYSDALAAYNLASGLTSNGKGRSFKITLSGRIGG